MLEISISVSILLAMLVFIGMTFTMKAKLDVIEEKQDKYNNLQERMLKEEFKNVNIERRLTAIEKNNNKILDTLDVIKLAVIK